MTTQRCEVCFKSLEGDPIIHVAGFPERAHHFCSPSCRDRFLRMEDDELEFNGYVPQRDQSGKEGG